MLCKANIHSSLITDRSSNCEAAVVVPFRLNTKTTRRQTETSQNFH